MPSYLTWSLQLEKAMATHSSVLAWRILWTEEPGGLLSMGQHRVGPDWSNLAAAAVATTIILIPIQPVSNIDVIHLLACKHLNYAHGLLSSSECMFSKKTELDFILPWLSLGYMLRLHKINFLFFFFRRKFYNMVIVCFF